MNSTGQPVGLTREQAAARLGISNATLTRMRTNGTGPEYLKIGNRVWYEPAKIDEWVSQQRRTQTDQRRKASHLQQAVA